MLQRDEQRIAHHYGKIELEIVWDVVMSDIPALIDFCEKQLDHD